MLKGNGRYMLYKTYDLNGPPGNAMDVVGCHLNWMNQLRRANCIDKDKYDSDKKKFQDEVLASDYKHVLETCTKWFGTEFIHPENEDEE